MHPTAAYQVTEARIADRQRQSQRSAMARAQLIADQLRVRAWREGRGLA